jgi:uncharacterized membrane protein
MGRAMIPFYFMIAAIAIARAAGTLWAPLDDWHAATRAGLAAMFVLTGTAHFNRTRGDLVRMVPPALPNPELLVTLTGIAELAGAAALLVPAVARIAAFALIALLIAMFPANVYAEKIHHTIGGRRHTPMAFRLPLQLVWIGLLWWSTSTLGR